MDCTTPAQAASGYALPRSKTLLSIFKHPKAASHGQENTTLSESLPKSATTGNLSLSRCTRETILAHSCITDDPYTFADAALRTKLRQATSESASASPTSPSPSPRPKSISKSSPALPTNRRSSKFHFHHHHRRSNGSLDKTSVTSFDPEARAVLEYGQELLDVVLRHSSSGSLDEDVTTMIDSRPGQYYYEVTHLPSLSAPDIGYGYGDSLPSMKASRSSPNLSALGLFTHPDWSSDTDADIFLRTPEVLFSPVPYGVEPRPSSLEVLVDGLRNQYVDRPTNCGRGQSRIELELEPVVEEVDNGWWPEPVPRNPSSRTKSTYASTAPAEPDQWASSPQSTMSGTPQIIVTPADEVYDEAVSSSSNSGSYLFTPRSNDLDTLASTPSSSISRSLSVPDFAINRRLKDTYQYQEVSRRPWCKRVVRAELFVIEDARSSSSSRSLDHYEYGYHDNLPVDEFVKLLGPNTWLPTSSSSPTDLDDDADRWHAEREAYWGRESARAMMRSHSTDSLEGLDHQIPGSSSSFNLVVTRSYASVSQLLKNSGLSHQASRISKFAKRTKRKILKSVSKAPSAIYLASVKV